MVNISLRPTQDDIDLLKKELVQVQQLTDTIVREKENENKHLKRDYDNMKRNLEEYWIFLNNWLKIIDNFFNSLIRKAEEAKTMTEKLENLKQFEE